MAGRILKRLTFTGLLDETFDLYKSNFVLFAGIAALLNLPTQLAFHIFGARGWQAQLVGLVVMVAGFISTAAATWAVSEGYLGSKATIIGAYRIVLHRAWPLIGTMLLEAAALVLGIMLCVIPGIVLLLWYSFVSQVCVLEDKAWLPALARSRELARGQAGRILLLQIVILALELGMRAGYSSLMAWATRGEVTTLSRGTNGLIFGTGLGLLTTLTSPLRLISFILLYYDIRVRKEGFDIKWLARNMAASSPRPKALESAKPI